MPEEIVFTLPDPDLGDPCPQTPEGASTWERQEIDRCWRNVLHYARDAMGRIASATQRPADRRPAGNDVQAVTKMVAAQAELAARIEAVEHRQALETRRRPGPIEPTDGAWWCCEPCDQ